MEEKCSLFKKMIVHNFLDFLEKEEKGNKCILRIRFIYTQFILKFLFKEFWKNFKLQKKNKYIHISFMII